MWQPSLVPETDHPHYMPDAKPVVIKLVVDARTRKLLGAQAGGNQLNGFVGKGLARNLLSHFDAAPKLRLNFSICAYNCIVRWT